MFRRLLVVPLLLAAGPLHKQAAPAGLAVEAPIEEIGFEISSWGRPIDSWEVRADGSAHHATMVSQPGAPFGHYRLEHREFTIEPADYARLVALAQNLPQPRPQRNDCKELATDFPYGALELAKGGTSERIAFDLGCQDVPYQAFVGQLRAMDEQATALAGRYPVARVEAVGAD